MHIIDLQNKIYNIDLLYIIVCSLIGNVTSYICLFSFVLFFYFYSILCSSFLCFTVYTYLWIKMQTHTEVLKIVMGIRKTEFVIMICWNGSEETKGKTKLEEHGLGQEVLCKGTDPRDHREHLEAALGERLCKSH